MCNGLDEINAKKARKVSEGGDFREGWSFRSCHASGGGGIKRQRRREWRKRHWLGKEGVGERPMLEGSAKSKGQRRPMTTASSGGGGPP